MNTSIEFVYKVTNYNQLHYIDTALYAVLGLSNL